MIPPYKTSILDQLRAKTASVSIKAALWTILGFGSGKVIQLVSNIILTRILFPEAFGLMVIVNVVLIGLAMLSDIGLKPAIIQHPRGHEDTFLNTAWTVQIIRGFILFLVACSLAWPLAILYEQPLLTAMICACATTTIAKGFCSIAMATAERDMALKRVTLIELSAQMLTMCITIGLALSMQSVWSLVLGNIITAFVTCVLSHLFLTPHKHKILWHTQSWQEMKSFGRWIMASTLFTFVGGHGIKAIEATFITLEDVAFLQIATTMALSIRELISALRSKVLFPKLSRIQRETPTLFTPVFQKLSSKLLLAALIGYGLLALLSMHIINLLYDERYFVSHQYLTLYAIGGLMAVIASMYSDALLSKGLSKESFYITASNAFLQVISVFIGFNIAGIIGMVSGSIFASTGTYILAIILASKHNILLIKTDIAYIVCVIIIAWLAITINFPQALIH
ncbi:oligosaccharide flippase family protein [Marinagarivorans algicola]|uniref:oligosaccharide flippase family protein n=1 Tax=Marinagarivorans algicola TaxID=1513270 RepID=UPI0006B936D2|nr:oligosaccharide flippase family protein [Marinagarivorans algicola]